MNTIKLIELVNSLKKLEEYLPSYRRSLETPDTGGFKLGVLDGVLEVCFSIQENNLAAKAVLHTWSEHPHNGSIYDQQEKEIGIERAAQYLESAIRGTRDKAKKVIKERLIDQLVEKELTSQGL